MRVLERSGVVSSVESKTAVEEFNTFVVDVRARHLVSGCQSNDISDVITYLLADYGFVSRKSLCRVFKLCCLMIRRPFSQYLQVEIDLGGCRVPAVVVKSCIRGIQSYVSALNYKQGAFLTKHTMECVRSAVSGSQVFCCRRTSIRGVGYVVMVMLFLWSALVGSLRLISLVVRMVLISGYITQTGPIASSASKVVVNPLPGCALKVRLETVVSAPPAGTSSSSSSFRQNTTRIHSSLASLLGRKKDHKEGESSVAKKMTNKRRKKCPKVSEFGLEDN